MLFYPIHYVCSLFLVSYPQVVLTLKEYLSCGDKDEVVRCLQELAVPHFHHEVVYEVNTLLLFYCSMYIAGITQGKSLCDFFAVLNVVCVHTLFLPCSDRKLALSCPLSCVMY